MTQLATLTTTEFQELEKQEAIIERGLQTFYEVGEALTVIREGKLYKADYATFEDYCQIRWGFASNYARRIMGASEVVQNLVPMGTVLPTTERQIRPMVNLEPELQRQVWQQAVDTSEDGKPTAAHVQSVVDIYRSTVTPEPELDDLDYQSPPPKAIYTSQRQDMGLLTSSKNDSWRTPKGYIEAAREVMGGIDLDPASSEIANEIISATYYFTKEDDGLSQEWQGRVWLNPPYGKTNGQSNQGLFAAKLAQEYEAGRVTQAILLVNLYAGYSWFAPLRELPWCVPDHRISFIDPDTGLEGDEAKASSVFVYFGLYPEKFYKVFRKFGPCGRLSY